MNLATWSFLRAGALGLLILSSQTACARADAPAAAQVAPAVAASAPVQVAGFPDLTGLVERNAPAVVNITAVTIAGAGRSRGGPLFPDDEEIPEFFRRFFGPPGGEQGERELRSGGSGFVISSDGYILTNNHVVRGADDVTVRFADRREFTAEVVGTDPDTDIALLKVDTTGLPTVPLGDSNALKPGQWVFAIGSPFGFDHSVTAGVVSATGRSVGGGQQYVPFIQTDVAINRGNSGGPLFNLNGEVVGINSQIFSGTGGYMGISFAIPMATAQNVVEQLKSDGRVRRGLIGVEIQEVTREFAQSLGLERPTGALVARVVADGAADQAGVRVGDVILSFGGTTVNSSSELPVIVGTTRPGTRVPLEVFRDGRSRTLNITVAEAQPNPEAVTGGAAPEPAADSANRLGMVLQELTAEQRSQLELGSGEGVLVARVTGGAARRGNLQRGDVILRVGRTAVGSPGDFNEAVKDVKAGDSVMLLVRRGGGTSFIALNVREGD